jgi:hypothetical protein
MIVEVFEPIEVTFEYWFTINFHRFLLRLLSAIIFVSRLTC